MRKLRLVDFHRGPWRAAIGANVLFEMNSALA